MWGWTFEPDTYYNRIGHCSEGIKLVAWLWRNGTRNSVWNIPSGKTELPFQMSLCSRKFSAGLTQKVVFHLLSNQVFRKFFFSDFDPSNTVTLIFRYVSPLMRDLYYNHGEKCWDSCTVRTLFNTREIVPRAATLYVPTPYHHPTDSVETVKAQFLWSFNIVLGEEGEWTWICKKTALLLACFLRHNLWNA